MDWVVTSPCSTEIVAPVRETKENDATWQLKKGIMNPRRYPMAFEHRKWVTANKKYLAVIKNTIEPAIVGSIPKCDTVTEYLDTIKRQFTGSSKTYATQLIKQLVIESYSGNGGIRARDASSKLWHCRLGHISRGRIERLVKNNILPPLELSECIKGKYVKKDDNRSIEIL